MADRERRRGIGKIIHRIHAERECSNDRNSPAGTFLPVLDQAAQRLNAYRDIEMKSDWRMAFNEG